VEQAVKAKLNILVLHLVYINGFILSTVYILFTWLLECT